MSDLHLEHCVACQVYPVGEGDVLVLAGDILCAKHFKTNGYIRDVYNRFLEDCSKNYQKVLYVFGNHEYYQYNYEGAKKKIEENLPDNFYLLDNDTVKIGDWHFLGATFWTDHNKENPLNMMENGTYINDYKVIRITSNFRRMNPDDTLGFHKESKKYLEEKLKLYRNDNVFIVTHMAPYYQSNSPRFRGESTNSAFCSDLDDWILEHPQIKYWVHGHLHSYSNYTIGNCNIICNPVGYPGEITNFHEDFYLEI